MSTSPERMKHLEFIQATIARQASHAFAVKGWSLTVAAVIYAYTASNLSCWLDLFYLRQERLFRELYREAHQPESTVPVFEMDPSPYRNADKYPRCSYQAVGKSSAWWPLHVTIVGVGIVLLGVAIFQ